MFSLPGLRWLSAGRKELRESRLDGRTVASDFLLFICIIRNRRLDCYTAMIYSSYRQRPGVFATRTIIAGGQRRGVRPLGTRRRRRFLYSINCTPEHTSSHTLPFDETRRFRIDRRALFV